jgi:hypothetical protein
VPSLAGVLLFLLIPVVIDRGFTVATSAGTSETLCARNIDKIIVAPASIP